MTDLSGRNPWFAVKVLPEAAVFNGHPGMLQERKLPPGRLWATDRVAGKTFAAASLRSGCRAHALIVSGSALK